MDGNVSLPAIKPAGEIILARDTVRVVARPKPFSTETIRREVQAGATIAELVTEALRDPRMHRFAKVWLDGYEILPENWARIRPKPGRELIVTVAPAGFGGGGSNPLRLVLQLAILAASVFIPPLLGLSPVIGAIVSGVITFAGSLLLNALIPPTAPRMKQISDSRDSPSLSIAGTRNQANPYGAVPRVFGRHRIYPNYGALPFTEIRGTDQFLILLFCVGYGPLNLEDHRIGETPLADFDDVKIRVRPGYATDEALTIYTQDVTEEALSILITEAGGWVTRRTEQNTDRISIDLSWLQGLVDFEDDGGRDSRTVDLECEFSLVDSGVWQPIVGNVAIGARTTKILTRPQPQTIKDTVRHRTVKYWISLDDLSGKMIIEGGVTFAHDVTPTGIPIARVELSSDTGVAGVLVDIRSADLVSDGFFEPTLNVNLSVDVDAGEINPPDLRVTANSTSVVRRNKTFDVETGQYDVRIRRLSPDTSSDGEFDEVTWTALRSIANRSPINMPGVCTVEMEIKATDQLNGIIDQYNCIASSLLWDWDGADWVEQETANPAACYLEVLRGGSNHRPVDQGKIDWDAFEAWAESCEARGRAFNAIIDFRTTVFELLRDIGSGGRARFDMRDGLYSIVEDKERATPVQHFTPRNSFGFSASKAFPDRPHGLKVRFVNEDTNWQQDERIVYADGYSDANATLFEGIDAFGITDADNVFRSGRYLQAVAKLRPESYEVSTDIEHILCRIGDLVLLTHDVMLVGLAAGRLKTVSVDGSNNVTGVTVDQACPMAGGTSYRISVRAVGNARVLGTVVTNPGSQTSLTFSPSIAHVGGQPAVAAGNVFGFGELGEETIECIVKEIRPEADLGARLVLIDHAPEIHDVDDEAIPDFDPHITLPPALNDNAPPTPSIQQVRSDESTIVIQADGSWTIRIVMTLAQVSTARVPAQQIEVQFRATTSEEGWQRQYFPGDAAEVSAGPVDEGESYDVRVRAIGPLGQTSAWALVDDHVVVGKTTPPADITGFQVTVQGLGIAGRWDVHPDIDVRIGGTIVIRYTPVTGVDAIWESASEAARFAGNATTGNLPLLSGTFLAKALDITGRYSDAAAKFESSAAGVISFNAVETLTEHPEFLGDKDGVTVIDGALTLQGAGLFSEIVLVSAEPTIAFYGGVVSSGEYRFSDVVDLGEKINDCLVTIEMVIAGYQVGVTVDSRPGTVDTWESWDGGITGAGTASLYIATTDDDPGGSPTWSDWAPFVPGFYSARAFDFMLVLSSSQPDQNISVTTLAVTVDMPDRIEGDLGLATSGAGDVTVSYAVAFRAQPALNVTVTDMASGDRLEVLNETSEGFDVNVKNSGGTRQVRNFNYIAKGYGSVD